MKKILILACLWLAYLGLAIAGDDWEITEGFQYEVLSPAQATRVNADQIEVVELFWYGCPHCYRFEPYLHHWLPTKPDNVKFVRIPAIFSQGWIIHARLFYTMQLLGIQTQLHSEVFDTIHKTSNKLMKRQQIEAFLASKGIDKKTFDKVFDSFGVESLTRQAHVMTGRYGITGVPSIIVNGKYRTDAPMAGGFDKLLKVVDFLIEKESKALASTSLESTESKALKGSKEPETLDTGNNKNTGK